MKIFPNLTDLYLTPMYTLEMQYPAKSKYIYIYI